MDIALIITGYIVVGLIHAYLVGRIDPVNEWAEFGDLPPRVVGTVIMVAWPIFALVGVVMGVAHVPGWLYQRGATVDMRRRERAKATATTRDSARTESVDDLIRKIKTVESLAELEVIESTIYGAVGRTSREMEMARALIANDHVGGTDMAEVRYGKGAVEQALVSNDSNLWIEREK